MALFKILKGQSENLQKAAFHPGYAYFTPDDGKFYIDVGEDSEIGQGIAPVVGNVQDGKANRICINQRVINYATDYDVLDCGTATEVVTFDDVEVIFDCN